MPHVFSDLIRTTLCTILFIAAVAGSACPSLAIESSWLSANNGKWTDASQWSTSPDFPDNGRPNAGDPYTVLIDATGAPYFVSLNGSVSVDEVTIDSMDATLALRNSRLETARININGGTLLVSEAEIVGSEITGDGLFIITPEPSGVTTVLDAVTLGVDLSVPDDGNRLTLRNGLTLQDDIQLEIGGIVDVEGTQAIDGSGTVLFHGSFRVQPNSTFTIGPNITLHSRDVGGLIGFRSFGAPRPTFPGVKFINEGFILVEAPGRDTNILYFDPVDQPEFDNRGVMEVRGTSRLRLDGDWVNNGTIRVREQGELWLAGEYRWSDLGNLDRIGGTVRVGGVVDNFGSTIEANAETGPLILGGISGVRSSIQGGKIDAKDGQSWEFDGPELVDVTVATDVSVLTNRIIDIVGDLTLDQATITASDRSTWLRFQDSLAQQSILGNGKILFQGRPSRVSFGGLTIGEGIILDAATQGSDPVRLQGSTLDNNGALFVRPGATMRIVTSDFTNQGIITNEGRLFIGDNKDRTWRNNGSIILKSGSRTNFNGTITADGLGTIVDEGSIVVLNGIIDLQNGTLDFESLPFQENLRVFGGEFHNGRLTSSGDKTLDFVETQFSAFFDNITLATDLFIRGGAGGAGVWVNNGLTLEDSTITMPEGAALLFRGDDQRLDGTGLIFAPNRPLTSSITRIGGDKLVIGEGIIIRNGTETFRELELNFKNNRGRIIVEAPNALVTIGENEAFANSSSWSNNGRIEVLDGTVQFWGNYSVNDIGTLEFIGGEVVLLGNVLNEGRTIQQNASTGSWKFRGTVHGGRLETSDDVFADVAGTFNDVTIAGEAVVFDKINSSSPGVLRTSSLLNFDGGILRIDPSALLIVDQPTLFSGKGEIVLNGTPQNARIIGNEMTIGLEMSVVTGSRGGGSIGQFFDLVINRGTISAETYRQTLVVDGALKNTGTLQAINRAILQVDVDDWVNEGLLKLVSGRVVINSDSFENGIEGMIMGKGIINLSSTPLINKGTIAPGNSTGRLLIEGSLELLPTSLLDLEIGGLMNDDFDSIAVSLAAILDGTMNVSLIDNFSLGPNQEFLVLNIRGEVSGVFIGLPEGSLVGSFGGSELFITYLAGTGK